MMRYRKLARTHLLIPLLLLAGLALSGTPTPVAQAAVGGCRSDPIVVLSDGTVLDVSAAIDTAAANVTGIHYVVHGPRGVTLVSALSTPTLGFSGKESFTYYDDAQPNQYVTETLVRTAYNQVSVTAHTTFVQAALGYSAPLAVQYRPVTGFNDQALRVELRR